MSDTVRRGMIEIEPGSGRFCRYWMRHDPSWYRRELTKQAGSPPAKAGG